MLNALHLNQAFLNACISLSHFHIYWICQEQELLTTLQLNNLIKTYYRLVPVIKYM